MKIEEGNTMDKFIKLVLKTLMIGGALFATGWVCIGLGRMLFN